jgi:hypothetical protein
MPWYRVNGMMMHLNFGRDKKRIPVPCQAKHAASSNEWCAAISEYQCDWKLGDGRRCDKWICKEHALNVAQDKHLCPNHQIAYAEWLKRKHENDAPMVRTA